MPIAKKTLPGPGGLTFQLQSSRRRRSVGLTVTVRGELVVHAPQGMSLPDIQAIITRNLAWVVKKQAERQEAWARLEPGKVYYRGQALTLQLITAGPGVCLADGLVQVGVKTVGQDPWPQLLKWYLREAETLLTGRVRHFAPIMGLTPPFLELRDWRRRWGECHTAGRLRFNWRLVFLPPEIMEYLVVHELAHLIVPGHPPRFWQTVGRYLADYAHHRRWLKLYGSPFLTWEWNGAGSPTPDRQGTTPLR
jgi:predicted metal-dependent hydrolase